MHSDPRAWFDATALRMLAGRSSAGELEVVGDLDVFQADKRRRVLRWLAARPLAGRHLLEVGCGAAGNLRFLGAHGARVEGADISPKMIEVAAGLNAASGVEFPLHVIDGSHLPHADATFDVVLTVTALQHNHDGPQLDTLASEMVRVLRPGGEAWILEGVHAKRTVHRQSVHRSRAEYEAMFVQRGLVVRQVTALHSHYPHWMARYQQVSTALRRAVSRWRGGRLHTEADYLQRYGDGARLDGLASRSVFALSRLADPLHRGPDALGIFVFEKPASRRGLPA
jgi:SAM-dependent methyltransferase